MAGGGAGAGGTTVVGWRGPTPIASESALSERVPSVAADAAGNAVVVYERDIQILGGSL